MERVIEKRYQVIITTLVGIIGFVLGSASSVIVSDARLNSHREMSGHPLVMQRMNRVEKSFSDIEKQVKEMNNKLTVILINQESNK